MATVTSVTAQFGGGTVPFQIPQPVGHFEQRDLNVLLGCSASDVLNRLSSAAPPTKDVATVLMLAYGGEMYPVRGSGPGVDDQAKRARAMPWTLPGATIGVASYAGLAILILRAYLFGIDSTQASWGPAA